MVKLIGLYSSAMGAGKSTVAKYLVNYNDFNLIKFAQPLKAMLREVLPYMVGGDDESSLDRCIEGDLKETPIEPYGFSPRQLMQTLGTEWGRKSLYENFWVDITKQRIKRYLAAGESVVVDDMRYQNEFDAIKELGGETWRVFRDTSSYSGNHSSEGALDKCQFDWTIENDGTIHDLAEATRTLLIANKVMGSN